MCVENLSGEHLYEAECASGVRTHFGIMKCVFISLENSEKTKNSS